jgi:2,4-diketo-3-deoxy-L-fuconate hydrolase
MKLIRFGPSGREKPGVLREDGTRVDLSAHFNDWDRHFFHNDGLGKLADILRRGESFPEVSKQARLGSCISRPGKVVCIGLNYTDHAAEAGLPLPSEPIVFLKASNTVVGPFDPIIIPRTSSKTDWEVELGVVIGKDARYLPSVAAAAGYVAGYCISHDVSERTFQLERGGQWTKGKSCDNFNPLGPFLAPREEIGNAEDLRLRLWVNGELRQQGSTATMVFDVPTLVHYLSQFMTLEAGDLISTGTPPGVGMGMQPPHYLRPGDVVELEIDGLGRQRSVCVPA